MRSSLHYDANGPLDPAWSTSAHRDRVEAVLRHHRELGGRHVLSADPSLHARLHVTVEDQLASEVASVVEFFARFARAGVVRHEIVHAASATFAEAMRMAVAAGDADASALYAARLENLQPADWIARAVRSRVGLPDTPGK